MKAASDSSTDPAHDKLAAEPDSRFRLRPYVGRGVVGAWVSTRKRTSRSFSPLKGGEETPD